MNEINGVETKALSITTIINGENSEANGFFNIEENRLCTTSNLNLNVDSISWSETNNPTLDIEICLDRVNET